MCRLHLKISGSAVRMATGWDKMLKKKKKKKLFELHNVCQLFLLLYYIYLQHLVLLAVCFSNTKSK